MITHALLDDRACVNEEDLPTLMHCARVTHTFGYYLTLTRRLANVTRNLTFGLSAYVMDCDKEAHEAGPAKRLKTSGSSKASMTRNWVATQRVIRKANMNYNRAHSNDIVHEVFH